MTLPLLHFMTLPLLHLILCSILPENYHHEMKRSQFTMFGSLYDSLSQRRGYNGTYRSTPFQGLADWRVPRLGLSPGGSSSMARQHSSPRTHFDMQTNTDLLWQQVRQRRYTIDLKSWTDNLTIFLVSFQRDTSHSQILGSLSSLTRPLTFDMQTSTSDLTLPTPTGNTTRPRRTDEQTGNTPTPLPESRLAVIGKKLAKRGHTKNSIQVP